jgi:hypothetical protein
MKFRSEAKWTLRGLLFAAIAFSALGLPAKPSYASTCTTVECESICEFYCNLQGGCDQRLLICNDPTGYVAFACNNGTREHVAC